MKAVVNLFRLVFEIRLPSWCTHRENYFRSKGLIQRYTEVAKNRKMNEPQLYAIISMSEPNQLPYILNNPVGVNIVGRQPYNLIPT